MSLATPKRWPGLVLATVLSILMLPFVTVTIAEGLVPPVIWLVLLVPWVIVWHVQRSETRCPACKKVSALRARTFSEDPGLRCRFCGHRHDPETDPHPSPLAGDHEPARGLEKVITLFAMCVGFGLLVISTVAGETGAFTFVPVMIMLIGFARLYGWVPLGSGAGNGGGGAGGGGGGGGC